MAKRSIVGRLMDALNIPDRTERKRLRKSRKSYRALRRKMKRNRRSSIPY